MFNNNLKKSAIDGLQQPIEVYDKSINSIKEGYCFNGYNLLGKKFWVNVV